MQSLKTDNYTWNTIRKLSMDDPLLKFNFSIWFVVVMTGY